MRNFKIILFTLFSTGILVSCGFSSDMLASESVRASQILCNPFSAKGFHGVLSINSSQGNFSYESNTSILAFYDVPDVFKTQRNTYIQLRGINYTDNKISYSDDALEVDVLNLRNNNPSNITPYIDHNFIRNSNYELNEFFADHAFIVKNTAGWDILYIGLFNEYDQPIADTKVLIPPFEANPYIYEENNLNNQTLNSLHPFNNLKRSIERANNDVFLSRAQAACHENPI
ncbi:MAG: hypothetical protein OXK80_01105 [Bdellovibrionales bacterium]|nr:hypothetical protein [Bdellovibrionales bacterium]